LPRQSLRSALEAAGHEVLLFASRGEDDPGYYGTALLGEAMPDPTNARIYLLPLHDQKPLSRAISLKELHALGVEEMPFHTYAHPIRKIAEGEQSALVSIGAIPDGFGEEATQVFDGLLTDTQRQRTADYRALRFEMLELYGPRCAFLRRSFANLHESRFGIDVGHLWPHWAGGPDIIQNVLPMSKDVNNQWDEGLVSLRNNGELLIAHKAGHDTKWLFAKCKKIVFPEDVGRWPDAKYLERHRDEIFEKGPNSRFIRDR
jgi:hypothetical protein